MVAARTQGFGLVELLVALTILGAGILAVAGTALVAARRLRASELQQEAVLAAAGVLDSVAFAGPPVVAGTRRAGALEIDWVSRPAGAGADQLFVRVSIGSNEVLRFATVVAANPIETDP